MAWVRIEDLPTPEPSRKEIEELVRYSRMRIWPRFVADESVPDEVLRCLQRKGLDVLTHHQAGLTGHSDEDYISFAKRDGRILVTCDTDFLDDRRFPLLDSPCIVVVDLGAGTQAEIRSVLALLQHIGVTRFPRLFDKWVKLYIHPNGEWTQDMRFRDGSSLRERCRLHRGYVEVWQDE